MVRIGISGAAGRMGRTLIQSVQTDSGVQLTFALEQNGNETIGQDAGVVAGLGELGLKISDKLSTNAVDVLIEFTSPMATKVHVLECCNAGKAIVIGTTGLTDEDRSDLMSASQLIPIVFAPNMSVGVNLCFKLLEMAAKALGDSVDIEIVEAHHRSKVDAPSGTALKMGEVVAKTLGRTLEKDGIFARHGFTGPRDRSTIGFSTIRAGDIVGDHTVMFAGEGERIEITHRSNSRMTYAVGALRAAKWLVNKPPGLYEMADVLGLK